MSNAAGLDGYVGAMPKKCYTNLRAEEQSPIDVSETHHTNQMCPVNNQDTPEIPQAHI